MAPTADKRRRDELEDAMWSNLAQDVEDCEEKMNASLRRIQAQLARCRGTSVKNREDVQLMMEKVKHRIMGHVAKMKERLVKLEGMNTVTSLQCEKHSDLILDALKECHKLHGSFSTWKQREERDQVATNLGNEVPELKEIVFVPCSICNAIVLEAEQQDHVCHGRRRWPRGKI